MHESFFNDIKIVNSIFHSIANSVWLNICLTNCCSPCLVFDHRAAKIQFCLWYTADLTHEELTEYC